MVEELHCPDMAILAADLATLDIGHLIAFAVGRRVGQRKRDKCCAGQTGQGDDFHHARRSAASCSLSVIGAGLNSHLMSLIMMCFLVEASSIAHHSATLSSAAWLLLIDQQG